MRLDVHHFHHFEQGGRDQLDEILDRVKHIEQQGAQAMSKLEELESELQAANEATNEIASDIDDILAKLANPQGLSEAEADSLRAQLAAHKETLQGIAAKHTA